MSKDYEIDEKYLFDTLEKLIEIYSPVGYHHEIHNLVKGAIEDLGYETWSDNRATLYVKVEGADAGSKARMVGAHLDTLGLMITEEIAPKTFAVKGLGGVVWPAIEGESCMVYTLSGWVITGQIVHVLNSPHKYPQVFSEERDASNICVVVDGHEGEIMPGDIVAIDPRFEFHSPYLRSRFLDNKAAVATVLHELKWLKEQGAKLRRGMVFAFPVLEEIALGGSYILPEVDEYVVLDIAAMELDRSNEKSVGIIRGDAVGPYDWDLTKSLVKLAKETHVQMNGGEACLAEQACRFQPSLQVLPNYLSDARAAVAGSNDVRVAAFGPVVLNAHGREMCHVETILETARLLHAYVLS